MKFTATVTSVHQYMYEKKEKYNTATISCEINRMNGGVYLTDIALTAPEEQAKFELGQKMIITVEPA